MSEREARAIRAAEISAVRPSVNPGEKNNSHIWFCETIQGRAMPLPPSQREIARQRLDDGMIAHTISSGWVDLPVGNVLANQGLREARRGHRGGT
jgi:hypothetical protein